MSEGRGQGHGSGRPRHPRLGVEYFRLHWPDGTPTEAYFRVTKTATEMWLERYGPNTGGRWIYDAEMLDYYHGHEPGGEDVSPEEVRAAGIPL